GSPRLRNPQTVAFHQAEFGSLRAEISDLQKACLANFQYALLVSGATFAWLSAASHANGNSVLFPLAEQYRHFAWLLPVYTSSLFAALAGANMLQISRISDYILKLEGALGNSQLGWESFLKTRRIPTSLVIYVVGWLVLLIADLSVAALMPAC